MDILSTAGQIVQNARIKKDVIEIINKNNEDIQDIVVVFVTKEWEVDSYWTSLPSKSVIKVLNALSKGIENKTK